MAKRKAARSAGRKASTRSGGRAGSTARKAASRKGAAKRTAKRAAGTRKVAAKKGARKAAAKKGARKASARARGTARKAASATARKSSSRPRVARKATGAARKTTTRRSSPAKAAARTLPARPAPDLNRPRRRIADDEDLLPTPPSSLDLDRSASSTRSGRRELHERYAEHTETSPALTAGDVDADWESAYSVGDEAPGGDNPTPDQDVVDDIGRAVGVEYQDNEELKGADKVARRDKNRWELDPASSDDWDDR